MGLILCLLFLYQDIVTAFSLTYIDYFFFQFKKIHTLFYSFLYSNVKYIIQGPKLEHKRHLNQIRKRTTEDLVNLPQEEVEVIDTVYDTFDIEPPQTMPDPRRSGRKRKFTDPLLVFPKKKRY